VAWLDGRNEPLDAVEIWVRDPSGERWVDARAARYREGARTPMGYGIETANDGALDFDAAVERLRSEERARRRS
jgi:hypothetical protein